MEGLGAPRSKRFSTRASLTTVHRTGRQSIHGFDRTLRLVATRREDFEMDDIMEAETENAHS